MSIDDVEVAVRHVPEVAGSQLLARLAVASRPSGSSKGSPTGRSLRSRRAGAPGTRRLRPDPGCGSCARESRVRRSRRRRPVGEPTSTGTARPDAREQVAVDDVALERVRLAWGTRPPACTRPSRTPETGSRATDRPRANRRGEVVERGEVDGLGSVEREPPAREVDALRERSRGGVGPGCCTRSWAHTRSVALKRLMARSHESGRPTNDFVGMTNVSMPR